MSSHSNEDPATNTQLGKRKTAARSYIGRHWRGELSLPVSYFLNGGCLTLLLSVLSVAVTPELAGEYSPWGSLLALAGMWAFITTVSIWQIVGIWRSAGHHPERGGSRFWAAVARVMVILGILQTVIVVLSQGWPQLRESIRIVLGDPSVGAHHLRLLNGGTEVELSGGISFGTAKDLEKILDAAPEVHTIHLNSHGGRIAEAERIRDIIRGRDLDTYVCTECLSACTIAFLGGRNRFLGPSARIGFHAGSFPGVPEDNMLDANRRVIDEAVTSGLERSFAETAYLSPAASMWFPATQELLRSGFATRQARGQFAISGFGPKPSRDSIGVWLKRTEVFATIATAEPASYDQIVALFTEGAVRGLPQAAINSKIRDLTGRLVIKYASTASDDALLAMGQLLCDEIAVLRTVSPEVCYAFLFPEPGNTVDPTSYLDEELQKRDIATTTMIISSGSSAQEYEVLNWQTDALYEIVMNRLADEYGDDALMDLAKFGDVSTDLSKDRACEVAYMLYSTVMTLPDEAAAGLLRDMVSKAEED